MSLSGAYLALLTLISEVPDNPVRSNGPVRTEMVALASAGMTVDIDEPETLIRWMLRLGSRQLPAT